MRRRDGREPDVRPARGRPVDAHPLVGRALARRGRRHVRAARSSSSVSCGAGRVDAGARSRSAATSPPPTGSRRRRASPTPPSRSAARSPTPSPASRPSSVPMFIVAAGRRRARRGRARPASATRGSPRAISSCRTTSPGADVSAPEPSVPASCSSACTTPGARQMALGWFRDLAGDRARAWSGGLRAGRAGEPGRGRGDGRGRHRHRRPTAAALDRRHRAGRRRRRHDGLRRRLPVRSRASATRTGRSTIPPGSRIDAVRPIRDEIERRVARPPSRLDVRGST